MQLYVDDPCVAIRGTPAQRRRIRCIVVVTWAIFGLPLAFHKARCGSAVVWIGCQLRARPDDVVASIAEEKLNELRGATQEYLSMNVIPVSGLRSYVGLANHFATLLPAWRPFLSELWAAVHSTGHDGAAAGAPKNCVWQRQVLPALQWIFAFLCGRRGTLEVRFRRDAFWNRGKSIRIVGDASPWGLGAYLLLDGVAVEFYACPLNPWLTDFMEAPEGSPKGQQVWESLNLVVALRAWQRFWKADRVTLEVRGDSVAALTLLAAVRGKGRALTAVAREYALDLGDAAYFPDVCAHTPGVASTIADALSRRFAPAAAWSVPAALEGAREIVPPTLDHTFFSATVLPAFGKGTGMGKDLHWASAAAGASRPSHLGGPAAASAPPGADPHSDAGQQADDQLQ